MVNKEVVVVSDGMEYRGKLVEVTEDEISMQGPLGWITVPVESVTSMALADDEGSIGFR
jgi:hypothetical protein